LFHPCLEKRKEGPEKQKLLLIEALGFSMITYGSDLQEDSRFGQALLKMGEVEQKIGSVQAAFV
jgi:hypothetical protein